MAELLRSDVAVFRRARSIIAESLWWEAASSTNVDGALRWCDIGRGSVYRSPVGGDVDGGDDNVLQLAPPVSAFQPAGSGFVYTDADSVRLANRAGKLREVLATIRHRSDRIRFNEGKCDPAGRFVVGSMDLDGKADGAIYSVDPAGRVITIVGGIGTANGFEWTDDGTRMWFTDTATQTIYVGDYSERGVLSNVRPFASGFMSDGLARDRDGGFWNGVYDTGHVVHWSSHGDQDLEVEIPAGHVTAVAFGGEHLSTLFIATARERLTEQQLEDQPLTGSIFQVETSTHGFPVRAFGDNQKGTQWNSESLARSRS